MNGDWNIPGEWNLIAESRHGKHLNRREREKIEAYLGIKMPVAQIAKILDRPRTTIYNEIKRGITPYYNSTKGKLVPTYYADAGQRVAVQRQSLKGANLKLGKNYELEKALHALIVTTKNNKYTYSPDAALALLREQGWPREKLICTKTLYNYIHAGVISIRLEDLFLASKKKEQSEEPYRHAHHNPLARSIDDRPKWVSTRKQFGHWEADFIVGKQGKHTVLFTLVERKTRFCITAKFPNKKKQNVVKFLDQLEKNLGELFYLIFKSITFDNGSEFADYEGIERSIFPCRQLIGRRTTAYYAHPYRSSERGTNENTNGFLRRKIKKGSDIARYSNETIAAITSWTNGYPRKILQYDSARKAFRKEMFSLTKT